MFSLNHFILYCIIFSIINIYAIMRLYNVFKQNRWIVVSLMSQGQSFLVLIQSEGSCIWITFKIYIYIYMHPYCTALYCNCTLQRYWALGDQPKKNNCNWKYALHFICNVLTIFLLFLLLGGVNIMTTCKLVILFWNVYFEELTTKLL